MNPQKYGFRPHRCTEEIILQIIKYIDTHHKLNKNTYSVPGRRESLRQSVAPGTNLQNEGTEDIDVSVIIIVLLLEFLI